MKIKNKQPVNKKPLNKVDELKKELKKYQKSKQKIIITLNSQSGSFVFNGLINSMFKDFVFLKSKEEVAFIPIQLIRDVEIYSNPVKKKVKTKIKNGRNENGKTRNR